MAEEPRNIITTNLPDVGQQIEETRLITEEDPNWSLYLDDKKIDQLNARRAFVDQINTMIVEARADHLKFMDGLEAFYNKIKTEIQREFDEKFNKVLSIKSEYIQEMNLKAITWKCEIVKRQRDEMQLECERLERMKMAKRHSLDSMVKRRKNQGASGGPPMVKRAH